MHELEKPKLPEYELIPLGQTPVRVVVHIPHPVTGEVCQVTIEGRPVSLAELNHLEAFHQSDPLAEDGRSELAARRAKLLKVVEKVEGIRTDLGARQLLSQPAADDLCWRAWEVWKLALVTGEGFRNALAARSPVALGLSNGQISPAGGEAGPDASVSDVPRASAAAGDD
jgi:hypothetical protein